MDTSKRSISLAAKITIMTMSAILISTASIAILSYVVYRNNPINDHGNRAIAIAQTLASSIDSDEMIRAIEENEKNDYYTIMQNRFNQAKSAVGASFMFAGIADQDIGLITFMEALLPHEFRTADLNTIIPYEVFPPEFFNAQLYGRAAVSEVIPSGVDDSFVIAAYAPIFNQNMNPMGVVGVTIDVSDLFARSNSFALTMIATILGIVAVIIWMPIIWVRHNIGGPLNLLCEASNKIADGDMAAQIPFTSGDEVGKLAQAFRNMQSDLAAMIDETQRVSREIIEGNLSSNKARYSAKGDFNKIIDSIDNVAGNVHQYLNNLQCAIVIFDHDYRFAFINDYAKNQGYNPVNLLGKTIFEAIPANEAEVLGKNFDRVKLTGKIYRYKIDMVSPNGDPFNADQVIVPIRDYSGVITTYLISGYEITDLVQAQKRAEEMVRINEMQLAKMNLMVKATKIGMWDMDVIKDDPTDLDNKFTWSDDFRGLLGYNSEDEFPNLASSVVKAIHPEDIDRVITALENHILDTTGRTPYDIEYRIMNKNGEYGYYRDSAETMRDKNGKVVHMSGAMLDITATKVALIENEHQLNKIHLMIKAAGIGMWDMIIENIDDPTNPENPFTYSDEFRWMLGFTDESDFPNVFDSVLGCIHLDDIEPVLGAFEKHILDRTGKIPYDVEYRMRKKNGEYAYYRDVGETVRDEHGKPMHISGALLDVTETKNLIFEAKHQKQEAEEANAAKSAFLSTMSHEIRTPMNAILGITEIQLLDPGISSETKEAFEKIYASGDMLLSIINDILDLSKIEAGKLELLIDKYEIASLVSDTAQLNMMRIGSKPIEFELHVDENVPTYMIGDELRIKQILNNLLSNAFKYTKSGLVKLMVSFEEAEKSDEAVLVIAVSDTGQGMTEEQVSQLFDEFSRFNMEANRNTEGTGLGMNITKNLIQLMNGEIIVESEPGKGSIFIARLLQGKVDCEPIGEELADSLRQFRTRSRAQMKRVQITREYMPYGKILIVDDVETNIYVARGLMTPYGLKVDSSDSGFSAIEKVKSGKEYDVIFMDHMMPQMDGIETTKRLREIGYTKPIVALTANAVAGQAQIFLGNEFDDFISKPIDIRNLNVILNKLVRDKNPSEVVEAARQQALEKQPQAVASDAQKPEVDPQFIEIVMKDASRSLAVLEGIAEKGGPKDENELRTYVIHVHGMKSALANVGKMDLSAAAMKLEELGREDNTEAIIAETPEFLNELKAFVASLKPLEEEVDAEGDFLDETDEGNALLREKIVVIKAACEEYDVSVAEDVINELRALTWSQPIKEMLGAISEHLLYGDFDEVAEVSGKLLAKFD
ncbi:MAG: PAS domain-containing protein [Defluviitaleaceae bacterium]|nr:PAS domain-containing protein [Defluviitaleaceae bacterium]